LPLGSTLATDEAITDLLRKGKTVRKTSCTLTREHESTL